MRTIIATAIAPKNITGYERTKLLKPSAFKVHNIVAKTNAIRQTINRFLLIASEHS